MKIHDAADEAFRKLAEEGGKVGADAVIGIKFFSPEVVGQRNIGEVVAYGTAVKLRR